MGLARIIDNILDPLVSRLPQPNLGKFVAKEIGKEIRHNGTSSFHETLNYIYHELLEQHNAADSKLSERTLFVAACEVQKMAKNKAAEDYGKITNSTKVPYSKIFGLSGSYGLGSFIADRPNHLYESAIIGVPFVLIPVMIDIKNTYKQEMYRRAASMNTGHMQNFIEFNQYYFIKEFMDPRIVDMHEEETLRRQKMKSKQ